MSTAESSSDGDPFLQSSADLIRNKYIMTECYEYLSVTALEIWSNLNKYMNRTNWYIHYTKRLDEQLSIVHNLCNEMDAVYSKSIKWNSPDRSCKYHETVAFAECQCLEAKIARDNLHLSTALNETVQYLLGDYLRLVSLFGNHVSSFYEYGHGVTIESNSKSDVKDIDAEDALNEFENFSLSVQETRTTVLLKLNRGADVYE